MTALFNFAHRCWLISNPATAPKSEEPLVFGILGAADIAPNALIKPARSHPDVIVQTVAARDPAKASAYARKHGIPNVAKSYQAILDDPTINSIYIPLPNGLHYIWAARALRAGKHVLLEKPSTNNTAEATLLFHPSSPSSPPSSSPSPRPILLEAAHNTFHPAWALFHSLLTPAAVSSARATLWVPRWYLGAADIRFDFALGGGALMDLGAYTARVLRFVFSDDSNRNSNSNSDNGDNGGVMPEACESCETAALDSPGADARCDRWFRARYRFPGGGVGEMEGDLRAPLTKIAPEVVAVHRPVVVDASSGDTGKGVKVRENEEMLRTRKVRFVNFVMPSYVHSITVDDEFEIRETGATTAPRKTWSESKTLHAYTWREAGLEGCETRPGEPHWSTYRYQLEQFVNRVKGRPTTQWVEGDDSVATMRMIDMAYEAAKLPLRPTYEEEV